MSTTTIAPTRARRGLALATLLATSLLGLGAATADVELQNDSFVTFPMGAFFQGGLRRGEIAASRFIAPSGGRQLLSVRLLFGGLQSAAIVTVHVWADPGGGGNAPGVELFHGDFQLMGNNSLFFQAIPLATGNVVVPQQFRVGIELQMDSSPWVARDVDGTVAADRNYIYGVPGGWIRSQDAGYPGDWVLRAIVSDNGAGAVDAGVDASGGPDGGPGVDAATSDAVGPDAGTGAACASNAECPVGQYCDPAAHVCTLDCRQAADCASGGTCNSFGQCVGGGGCAVAGPGSSGGGAPFVMVMAGLVGALVAWPRRRRLTRL